MRRQGSRPRLCGPRVRVARCRWRAGCSTSSSSRRRPRDSARPGTQTWSSRWQEPTSAWGKSCRICSPQQVPYIWPHFNICMVKANHHTVVAHQMNAFNKLFTKEQLFLALPNPEFSSWQTIFRSRTLRAKHRNFSINDDMLELNSSRT